MTHRPDRTVARKSYVFHVVNQSRFVALLSLDKFMAHLLGEQQPREVPFVRRNRSPVDTKPIGMFRSKYKWQGDKVIGLAEGR